jgi:hypothetical protein
MRKTYQIVASTIAVLVVVQAAAIAYAIAGVFTWIDEGNTLDKSVVEGWEANPPTFEGSLGSFLHFFIIGGVLIPLLGLILLIISFFAKVPRGPMLAGIVVVAIVIQYLLGTFSASTGTPLLSLLHGLNAFVVFGAAVAAARAAKSVAESPPVAV